MGTSKPKNEDSIGFNKIINCAKEKICLWVYADCYNLDEIFDVVQTINNIVFYKFIRLYKFVYEMIVK